MIDGASPAGRRGSSQGGAGRSRRRAPAAATAARSHWPALIDGLLYESGPTRAESVSRSAAGTRREHGERHSTRERTANLGNQRTGDGQTDREHSYMQPRRAATECEL